MSVVLLTGAGASFGLNWVHPHSPPLGADLLDQLVSYSSNWEGLPGALRAAFSGSDGFELGFPAVRQANDKLTMPLLRDMAAYFVRFTSTQRSMYDFLLDAIVRLQPDCYFATLNYDLLFDEAIHGYFNSIDYAGDQPLKSILKLHGAPNLWIDPEFAWGIGTNVSGFANVAVGAPIRAFDRSETMQMFRTQTTGCPVIAMYSRDKPVPICPDKIQNYQTRFAELVANAHRVVVVGASYAEHDRHVWEPIENTQGELRIVNPDRAAFAAIKERRGARSTNVVAATLREVLANPELCFG